MAKTAVIGAGPRRSGRKQSFPLSACDRRTDPVGELKKAP